MSDSSVRKQQTRLNPIVGMSLVRPVHCFKSLNFHFRNVLLICLLSVMLQPMTAFGALQSQPLESSEEQLAESFADHPQINKLLAQVMDRSMSAEIRREALYAAVIVAKSKNDRDLELRTLVLSLEAGWKAIPAARGKELLDRAVELNKEAGNPRFTALLQVLRGRYLLEIQRYEEAVDWIKKAQASKLLPKRDLAYSYNLLIYAYSRLGLVRNAFDASRETIALFGNDDQAEELAYAQSNFAWMFVRTRRFDKAEQLYDEIAFGPEDKPYCGSLIARCEIALHRKNFDKAMQIIQLGDEVALPAANLTKARKRQLRGTFYLFKSRCLYAKGEFVKAESVCKDAIKLIPPLCLRSLEAKAQLGLIVAKTDSPQQAIEIICKAFDDAKALRNCRAIDKVHVQLFSSEALTKLYLENERFKEAYAQLKETKEIRDSLTVEDLELQLKLSEMHRQTEIDEQRLELIRTEEQAKTAQAELVAANAIADAEKSRVIRNVIGAVFILTLLGGIVYWFSENRRRQVQHELKETKKQAESHAQFEQKKRIEDIGQLTGSRRSRLQQHSASLLSNGRIVGRTTSRQI